MCSALATQTEFETALFVQFTGVKSTLHKDARVAKRMGGHLREPA
jgi:hypothetical protein